MSDLRRSDYGAIADGSRLNEIVHHQAMAIYHARLRGKIQMLKWQVPLVIQARLFSVVSVTAVKTAVSMQFSREGI